MQSAIFVNIIIQHAFNEAMYLVEQADDDKDGMVTSYNMYDCLFNLFVFCLICLCINFSCRWKKF